MGKYNINNLHIGDKATYSFKLKNIGEVSFTVDLLQIMPQYNLVSYDCFNIIFKHWIKANTDEKEFISDLSNIVDAIEHYYQLGLKISIIEITKFLVEKHISKHGRIIDADLCILNAEFLLVLNAISKAEGGNCLNEKGRMHLLNIMFQCVEQYYEDKLFITYRNEPLMRPTLISFKEFKHLYKYNKK